MTPFIYDQLTTRLTQVTARRFTVHYIMRRENNNIRIIDPIRWRTVIKIIEFSVPYKTL